MRFALLMLVVAACDSSSSTGMPDAAAPADAAQSDAASGDAATQDLRAPDDIAAPQDLAAVHDFAGDAAAACGGGYLNSDAGAAACPASCSKLVKSVPDEGGSHVPFGQAVSYAANPPASGLHWPSPAPWGVSATVVPREQWVHNLEHGGIVLLYNCPWPADMASDADGGVRPPDDCPDVVAALRMLHDTWRWPSAGDWCGDMSVPTHILVTPDPLLPARVAAVAWDWSLVADTVDSAAFQCFIAARYNRGPEFIPCF